MRDYLTQLEIERLTGSRDPEVVLAYCKEHGIKCYERRVSRRLIGVQVYMQSAIEVAGARWLWIYDSKVDRLRYAVK